MDPQQVPVLLLAFRRPELTAQVLSLLRQVGPRRLYVATDAAAPDRPGEAALVQRTREVIDAGVDWPCRLERLDRREHRGCRRGVAEAINWFFAAEAEGIVLEDDVLPEPSFFPFCAALLERYRHDERIGAISANNFQPGPPRDGASYYFSHYNHVWGWASWRRAWAAYDAELESWPRFRDQGWLEDVGGRRFAHYWRRQIDRVHRSELDTWDYIWTYSCWQAGLLTCLPAVNLVRNLGFSDPLATQTTTGRAPHGAVGRMDFPLRHPAQCVRDARADQHTFLHHFHPPLPRRVLGRLQRALGAA